MHQGRAHAHGHGHDHGHAHHRGDPDRRSSRAHGHEAGRRRLVFVLVITALFMAVEFAGGWIANSLALMADAGHMLSDVAALALSVFALWIARRPATPGRSFGFLRVEILAALANGITLVVISLVIFAQAWRRLLEPQPVQGPLMLGVAAAGLGVNVLAALLLHGASTHNLNLRGAYLHVLGDLLGSIAAIVAAAIILTTGWLAADPVTSCIVGALILLSSWRLVRESLDILLESTPHNIDLDAVHRAICQIPGIEAVHDLHVWTLTSGFLAMSGHARIADLNDYRRILAAIHARMHETFGITHVTVQLDPVEVYSIASPPAGTEPPSPAAR
jgi:cobalt-zinc-cadmium efflux system protein